MDKITTKVNSKLLTVLYIVGFVISGSFTALCLTTMGHSNWAKTLLIGMTIIFEFAKGISFFEFLSGKHPVKISKLWFAVWIVLMGFSLFASTAFSMNETSKSKNDSYKNSSAYKNSIDEQKRMKELIKSKEDQIEKAVKEKDADLKAMKEDRELLPKSYIKRRQEATANITKHSEDQQSKIDQYRKELEDLNEKLDNKSDNVSKNYNTEATSGYITILTVTAESLNSSGIYYKNKWSFEELELIFYFLLSFTLEIVICLFYYLKKYNEVNCISENKKNDLNEEKIIGDTEKYKMLQSKKSNKDFKLNGRKFRLISCPPKEKTEQSKKSSKAEEVENGILIKNKKEQIGFKMLKDNSNTDFDNSENLREYLSFVYNNKNGNLSPGQKKINDITGLSYKQIKSIKALLEEKGILKTDVKSTYLLVDTLGEAMKRLDLGEGL
ncbi:MAG: hypothetical protein ABF289_05570 [Clostridiales bacterium]